MSEKKKIPVTPLEVYWNAAEAYMELCYLAMFPYWWAKEASRKAAEQDNVVVDQEKDMVDLAEMPPNVAKMTRRG